MSFWQGNIFSSNENPLVTAAKGELFVPIGDEDHPPLARRMLIGLWVVVVIISVILFANRLYRQSITLPERNSAMIGYSIDDITDVPGAVTYAGVDFAYEITDFEGLITGCRYTAKGSGEEMAEVIDRLVKCYGEPDDSDKMALSVLTEADLATLGVATWTWNYGKHSVRSLEALDSWGSNVAGYYINPTYLYMDLMVTAGADGKVDMEIRYEVRPGY